MIGISAGRHRSSNGGLALPRRSERFATAGDLPIRTRPKRGTIEHFYSARPRSFIGHQDWRKALLSVRGGVTDEAIRTFVRKVGAAIDADTIDTREDTTLNWMPMTVEIAVPAPPTYRVTKVA
jgi:hypothetical protein